MNRSNATHVHNRKSPLFLIAFIALLLALLVSCQPPGLFPPGEEEAPKGASLVIQIDSASVKTLVPPISMSPSSYQVSGSGPDGATFSMTTSETQVAVADLAFGDWTITVDAKNEQGTVIGRGQSGIQLQSGAAQSVSIRVVPLDGTGTLQLDVSWTASDVQAPSVTAQLTPSSGSAISLSFTLGAGSATCTRSSIPTGYYTLDLQLRDNGTMVMGAVEIVRIVKDQTTAGTFAFTEINQEAGSSVQVNITPEMQDPIPVTLSGQAPEILAGGTMTVTASVPAEVGNVVYTWYLNSQSKATGASYTVGSGLDAGFYRLDVTTFSAAGTRAGSASHLFHVIDSASATLAWDANSEPDLAGYRIYYGNASGSYPTSIDVGKATTCTVSGLDPRLTYYFAATAYNTAELESDPSNEVVLNPL